MRNNLFYLIILIIFCSCSVKKEYFLNAKDFKGKTVIFTLQEGTSYQKVQKYGEHFGNSEEPNIHEVFKNGIEELSKETKINLSYSPTYIFPSDSVIPIMVSIKKIKWIFEEPKTSMYVNMEFVHNNNTIKITGTHKYKLFVVGTKSGNLKKALKDGDKQLLSTIW